MAATHVDIPLISDDLELKSYGIIRVRLPPSLDCPKLAAELSVVTPEILSGQGDNEYAFYRNILEEPDFPFDSLLQRDSDIGKALLEHFDISSLVELRLDDAFCVHYSEAQLDTSGAKHMDPSDITLNMCLEKSKGVQGSHVLFYGTQPLKGIAQIQKDTSFRFMVEQVPGYGTVHWGHHPHETLPLQGNGRRTNIIATYCYKDSSRSDVAGRSCYFTS